MLSMPQTQALLGVLAIVLLAAVALIVRRAAPELAHKLIYKPERGAHDMRRPVFPDHVIHEDQYFKTADGETLHGWLVRQQTSEANAGATESQAGRPRNGVFLICHGNRGSIANREDTALYYLDMDLDVFLFDYRGFGKSTGKTSEDGTYTDVDAAWEHLLSLGYEACDIVLLGRSLGAAIAAHLATHAQPAAVILESTFSTLADLAAELYPLLRRLFKIHVRYDTLSKIRQIEAPLLLVHSIEDELIGIHHSQALLKAAPQNTRLIEISGRHRDGFVTSRSAYLPAVKAFIDEHRHS